MADEVLMFRQFSEIYILYIYIPLVHFVIYPDSYTQNKPINNTTRSK